MITATAILIAQLGLSLGADRGVTNIESNVQRIEKQTWQAVTWTMDGELVDPSGKIVPAARAASLNERATVVSNVTAGISAGIQQGLDELYAVTGNVPTVGMTLSFHMRPTPDREDLTFYKVAQGCYDGTNDIAVYHINHDMQGQTPILMKRYRDSQGNMAVVQGDWIDWKNDNITTNGYTGCKRMKFMRPEFARGFAVKPNPVVYFGAPDYPFSFGGAVVTVDGYQTFTGDWTNAVRRYVRHYEQGCLKQQTPIEEE